MQQKKRRRKDASLSDEESNLLDGNVETVKSPLQKDKEGDRTLTVS